LNSEVSGFTPGEILWEIKIMGETKILEQGILEGKFIISILILLECPIMKLIQMNWVSMTSRSSRLIIGGKEENLESYLIFSLMVGHFEKNKITGNDGEFYLGLMATNS